MIASLMLSDLQKLYGGSLFNGNVLFDSVSTDTRSIQLDDLFVALRGANFDGHQFLGAAQKAGASALVVEECRTDCVLPQWVVANTTQALGCIAQEQRSAFDGSLVAITGSGGKTTVKEMLASILHVAANDAVFCTRGNLNNHIGVPLSLLAVTAKHTYAVIEMGASAVGEISYLTHMAKPHVALVNNVMPAHVEGFGSIDNIALAKSEIYDGLTDDGVAIVNLDDVYADQWLAKNQLRSVITFSSDINNENFSSASVTATQKFVSASGCPSFVLHIGGESHNVNLKVMGLHNVMNALAAASCAHALYISLADIVTGLEAFNSVNGRLNKVAGVLGSTVIDDSYNANPGAMCAAIDVLSGAAQKTILIVGDMGELGDMAEQAHADIGVYAKNKNVDYLLAFGELSKNAVDSFGENAELFASKQSLIERALTLADENSMFLVKGSRSAGMDAVADQLKL